MAVERAHRARSAREALAVDRRASGIRARRSRRAARRDGCSGWVPRSRLHSSSSPCSRPVLSPYDFDTFRANGQRFPQLEAPSSDHLMGTNVQSTDVLSRIIWGTQTELKVVLVSLMLSIVVGVPLGLFSGYFGGKLDRALVLIMDALLVFPFLLLAIVIAFLLSDKRRPGDRHGGDRDHGRLHPALLPRGPQPHDQHPRGAVRRSRACARREAVHDHPQVRLLQRRPERAAARDAERGRRDPHARGSRVPRLRDPADRGRRSGGTTSTSRLGRGLGHLVDGALPGTRDRAARDRAHAARRGAERDASTRCSGSAVAKVDLEPRAAGVPKRRPHERRRRSSRCATCACTTARCVAPCAPSTASRSTSTRARSSVSWASRAAGSRRSVAGSSGFSRKARSPTARSSTAAGTSSGCRRRSSGGCAAPTSASSSRSR